MKGRFLATFEDPNGQVLSKQFTKDASDYFLSMTATSGDNTIPSRLTNLSTRSFVQTGDDVQIGGFIIQGTSPKTVLVTATGPSLAAFGVPGVLADPVLRLFSGQTAVAENDDWQVPLPLCQSTGHTCGTPAQLAATGLAPTDPGEPVLLITLPPGPYTAIVSGVGGHRGGARRGVRGGGTIGALSLIATYRALGAAE